MKNPTPKKTKAPTVGAVGAFKAKQAKIKYSPKSTASEAQRERILDALRNGSKTSYDLRRIGCYQAPARIKELRDKFGYVITTEFVTLYDRDGYMHPRCARYTLISEPEGA
ncbi:helix-turn-helix domain-containing protein [Noviherbaspirillum sp.]|jgi:hypothetical protein|uniref:helix-turn-helix domain-containing protein n=1 Tax=Noviherbaspirillum sp. TaxID=1926288 RepID=UPI0025F529CE|nr:helix-turn-helix domain-containing protein [Noviherbaspirillum sp.]